MKLKSARLAAWLLLLTTDAGFANAAGTTSPLQQDHVSSDSTRPRCDTSPCVNTLFPFLKSLRDGAIEFVFGKHPTKDAEPTTPPSSKAQYKDELVLRFNVTTTNEEAALAEATARLFLDVWAFTDDFVDVRLHKNEVAPLLGLLPKTLQRCHSTLIPDLSAAVYNSLPSNGRLNPIHPDRVSVDFASTAVADDNLFFRDYQPYPVILRWMRLLEAMFPAYVQYITVGATFEGRDIAGLRVGVAPSSGSIHPRKTIVVTGGLHAREWISTSTVNYIAWSFITSFGKDHMISKLLDEFDLVFIPVMNPDGVEYTWQVDRLWRKSRQQTNLRYCRGLDLDHAFGYGWDSSVTTNDPCSEAYGGEKPFQAVEAQRLAAWARNETEQNNVNFVALLDLHSYSQQVLFPYSYTCAVDPPNLENLEELAAGIAKAIRLSGGQMYTVTSACEGAVAAADSSKGIMWPHVESGGGSAIDWFYHEMKAHFSYQIKLRDTGSYGFLLPKEYIIPTGEEIFDAMKYFGDYLLGNNGIERGAHAKGYEKLDNDDQDSPTRQELRKRVFVG